MLQEDGEQGTPLAQEAWVKGTETEACVDAELVEVGGVDQAACFAQLRQHLPLEAQVGSFEPASGKEGGQGEPQTGRLEVLLNLAARRSKLGNGARVHGEVKQLGGIERQG